MSEASEPQHPALSPEGVQQAESETYTQTARGRIIALPFALGFILLGGLLLAENQLTSFEVTPAIAGLILGAGLVLTFLFRFFASRRQERGLLFLALSLLGIAAVVGLFSIAPSTFNLAEWYPLLFLSISLALVVTFLLDRQSERGILGVAALFVVMGGAAFLVSFDIIPQDILQQIADYWPLLIALLGITLVPVALRRSAE
ncbi:MAG: hypothetical protein ACLFTK_06095 [Anaerolineales bacterium]